MTLKSSPCAQPFRAKVPYFSPIEDVNLSNCLRYSGTSRVSIALERAKKPPPNLSRDELGALKVLKNDPFTIVIRKADKGNALVILNSED